MSGLSAEICISDVPLEAALAEGPRALCLITGVIGASYRPLGAMMVCDEAGNRFGALSSGCIERDVAHHAAQALQDGQIRRLRYGAGSPFADLQLPCGGGLDILVLPDFDRAVLRRAQVLLRNRQMAEVVFPDITLKILPEIRFLIFGKGPETRALAALALASGYETEVYSPEEEVLQGLAQAHVLTSARWPEELEPDPRSAVALFFHDHDWEPPLLQKALRSQAFFVGAQGSKRAHLARCQALEELGLGAGEIAKLASPFGLIPSVRDAKTLAVSVLAQVIAQAQGRAQGKS